MREQGCQNLIRWRQFTQICVILTGSFDGNKVIVRQDEIFFLSVDCWEYSMNLRIFLTETVKEQFIITAGSVKSPLNWLDLCIIILHVV